MNPSTTKPTIGRKVWYWLTNIPQVDNGDYMVVQDDRQAFDATVTYVHPNGNVQLNICDHAGEMFIDIDVELYDPTFDDGELMEQHGHGYKAGTMGYATWMPYQKQLADKAKAAEAASANPTDSDYKV